ncbi:hypothetical protein B0H17DRAFT_1208904 [Mycena rosella]|uniref:Uncharacterized protein n=1 Tax=Mycena rosella TaxID=1033263 RepID=A0AAD7GA73_MYCRO|nr:hypothetical protein B0H17DRAFT_1208904 [Mycena rosella]
MDTIASRRFLASNVVWPANKFFIPHGGLLRFLHNNLLFKVFLVMSALFTDAYVSTAVPMLTHMFFAAQIRQNEFRVAYCTIPVLPQSAWTFHVILAMLRVVGFEGDGEVVAVVLATCARDEQCDIPVTFDYADYDTDGLVTQFFYHRRRPTQLHPIPVFDPSEEDYALADLATSWGRPADTPIGLARRFEPLTDAEAAANAVVMAGVVATAAAVEQIQAQESVSNGKAKPTLAPTRRSHRLLSAQLTASESLAEGKVRSVRKRALRVGSPLSARSSKRSSRFQAAVDASLVGGNWSRSPPCVSSSDGSMPDLISALCSSPDEHFSD